MNKIDELRELGYDVFPAALQGDDPGNQLFYVRGFGVGTYVGEQDDETWQGLIDTHDERLEQEGSSAQ